MSWNNSWLQSLCLECCNLFESLINLFQTYNCDSQTADSASTATALFSGIKTNINTLGFDCLIEYNDPTSEFRANKVETILQWAQDAGKETGQVFYILCSLNIIVCYNKTLFKVATKVAVIGSFKIETISQ